MAKLDYSYNDLVTYMVRIALIIKLCDMKQVIPCLKNTASFPSVL